MKKFLKNILFFITMSFLVLLFLSHIKMSDDYLIHKTIDTVYKKIAWNINLINTHPEKIKGSLIFLGPSIVEGGICDSTLESKGIEAVNLGIKHTGKETELYFLNRIVKYKPKNVFVYASANSVTLHPMTPLLYTPLELVSCGQSLNGSFFDYFLTRVSFVFDFLIWNVKGAKNDTPFYSKFGVIYQKSQLEEDAYNSIKNADALVKIIEPSELQKNWRKVYNVYVGSILNYNSQYRFLESTKECADFNSTLLQGIYIPLISDIVRKDNKPSYFPKNIPVQKLDEYKSLDRAFFWVDERHFSKSGAIQFTNELISQGKLDIDRK